MEDGLTRDERYLAQTTEQFAALGRFIQEFEQVVSAIRFSIQWLFCPNNDQQQLIYILTHSSSMTAKPLFDALRASIAFVVKRSRDELHPDDIRITEEILKYVASAFQELTSYRNILVHGTWYIGWASSDQEDFSEITLHKLSVAKEGLKVMATPKSVADLDAQTARCVAVKDLINRLALAHSLIADRRFRVRVNFHKVGDVWLPQPPPAQPA